MRRERLSVWSHTRRRCAGGAPPSASALQTELESRSSPHVRAHAAEAALRRRARDAREIAARVLISEERERLDADASPARLSTCRR